jgi:hypothetical protein
MAAWPSRGLFLIGNHDGPTTISRIDGSRAPGILLVVGAIGASMATVALAEELCEETIREKRRTRIGPRAYCERRREPPHSPMAGFSFGRPFVPAA